MAKTKIHFRRSISRPVCGTWGEANITRIWKKVTCKNCLKHRKAKRPVTKVSKAIRVGPKTKRAPTTAEMDATVIRKLAVVSMPPGLPLPETVNLVVKKSRRLSLRFLLRPICWLAGHIPGSWKVTFPNDIKTLNGVCTRCNKRLSRKPNT